MKELSSREKRFIKKLEKMKKDVKALNRPETVKKIDKAIKMLSDGMNMLDEKVDHAFRKATELYREALSDKMVELEQKSGIDREQPETAAD